jgi:hypothetical protein
LLTFILLSTGILLIVHGNKLFERSTSGGSPGKPATDLAAWLMEPSKAHSRAYDTRHGASLMQARHAIRTSRKVNNCFDEAMRPRFVRRRSFLSIRR